MDVSKVGSRTPQPPNQLDLGLSVVKLPLFTRIFWAAIDPLVQVEKLLSVSGQEGEHHSPQPACSAALGREVAGNLGLIVNVGEAPGDEPSTCAHHAPIPDPNQLALGPDPNQLALGLSVVKLRETWGWS